MLVNASKTFISQPGEEVLLYSANGNVSVYANDIDINGVIYAPNGTVQICGTNITINGMIIANRIQISANNTVTINQNVNLKSAQAFKYYNDELQIMLSGSYDKDNKAINLDVNSSFKEGTLNIYASDNGTDFSIIDTVPYTDSYKYSIGDATSDKYFKVIQTLENGFSKESNTIKMTYNAQTGEYEPIVVDTDGEKLNDMYEFFLETDKENIDTDGDGLTDYEEVFITGTDPLYKDSDENGILDGDENLDGDTLTNLNEIKIGTDPRKRDTDDDGLDDNYELEGIKIKGDDVNTYKTDPTKYDTDGDELSDGDEALLGFNPLVRDTDGNGIEDGKEKTIQSVPTYEAEDENSPIEEVNITMNATGNVAKTTTITNLKGTDTYLSNTYSLIGEPFELETSSEFNNAKLTFKVDKSKLGDTDFNNLQIMWFNEETRFFEIQDTKLDEENGVISTTLNHFSDYLVVDGYKWAERFKLDLYGKYEKIYTTIYHFNTVIAVDCSENMEYDKNTYIEHYVPNVPIIAKYKDYSCERLSIVNNLCKNFHNNEKIDLITFSDNIDYESGFKSSFSYDNRTNDIVEDYKIKENGSVNYNNVITKVVKILIDNKISKKGLSISDETVSSIIFISDGSQALDNSVINYAKQNNIIIHTIFVNGGNNINNLEYISKETGGTCNRTTYIPDYSNYYKSTYTEKTLDLSDTDGDGLSDCFECGGMLCSNGDIVYSDFQTKHSDNDDLEDGQEVKQIKMSPAAYRYISSDYCGYIFDEISNPSKDDSDEDGFDDKVDEFPLYPFIAPYGAIKSDNHLYAIYIPTSLSDTSYNDYEVDNEFPVNKLHFNPWDFIKSIQLNKPFKDEARPINREMSRQLAKMKPLKHMSRNKAIFGGAMIVVDVINSLPEFFDNYILRYKFLHKDNDFIVIITCETQSTYRTFNSLADSEYHFYSSSASNNVDMLSRMDALKEEYTRITGNKIKGLGLGLELMVRADKTHLENPIIGYIGMDKTGNHLCYPAHAELDCVQLVKFHLFSSYDVIYSYDLKQPYLLPEEFCNIIDNRNK